jgi:hypothetical protein
MLLLRTTYNEVFTIPAWVRGLKAQDRTRLRSRKCLRLQFPQVCVVASRLHQLFVGTSLYDCGLVHVPESKLINDHPIVCGSKLRTL